jgi:hypothetical protein
LVEHDLAKVGVAGSSPVFRSNIPPKSGIFFEVNPCRENGLLINFKNQLQPALVVKLVDTQDLKSCLQQCK